MTEHCRFEITNVFTEKKTKKHGLLKKKCWGNVLQQAICCSSHSLTWHSVQLCSVAAICTCIYYMFYLTRLPDCECPWVGLSDPGHRHGPVQSATAPRSNPDLLRWASGPGLNLYLLPEEIPGPSFSSFSSGILLSPHIVYIKIPAIEYRMKPYCIKFNIVCD